MSGRKDIVEFFQNRGVLINPNAIELLIENGADNALCERLLASMPTQTFVITRDHIIGLLKKPEIVAHDKKKIGAPVKQTCFTEDGSSESKKPIKIYKDVTGNSTCIGEISDFLYLFKDRFFKLSDIIKKRQELKNTIPIKKIVMRDEEVSFIGIVNSISHVKNGSMIEVEDDTSSTVVYAPKELNACLVPDEVVGIIGKPWQDIIAAKNIIRPEIPRERRINYSSDETYALFISDIHVGSKSFLENEWENFVRWISSTNEIEETQNVLDRLKYIIISGDIVEGIGIYPKQEDDLLINDIYEQYSLLSEKLSNIPSSIKIIIQPGNHDAVRQSLPQPALNKEIQKLFPKKNYTFVGNPCYIEIEGVTILIYHGQSIQDFATCIPNRSQNNPAQIMREMIRRRHMAPIYGGITSLAPEKKDYLIIDKIPDIFVTGHVHVTAVDFFRNILLINASAWQAQTTYQKMMDFIPDPGKAVAVNLQNLTPKIFKFT